MKIPPKLNPPTDPNPFPPPKKNRWDAKESKEAKARLEALEAEARELGGRGRAKAAVHDKLQALKQLRARVEAQEKSVAFCKERAEELRGAFSSTGSVSLVVVGMMIRRFPSLSLSLSLSLLSLRCFTRPSLPLPPTPQCKAARRPRRRPRPARRSRRCRPAWPSGRRRSARCVRCVCVSGCVKVEGRALCVCVCV